MNQICSKRVFLVQNKKVNIPLNSVYSNFTSLTTLNFGINFFLKVYFYSKMEKNEHHYWILHIRISLGTKFQFELTILIYWTKFAQKGYLRSKTEKLLFSVRPWSLFTIISFSTWGILMSLFLLVAETMRPNYTSYSY